MKYFFTSFVFLFFINIQSGITQCEPPLEIIPSGFGCSSDAGMCFIVGNDVNCSGFKLEIRFVTAGFDVINTGGMVLNNSGPITTLIADPIDFGNTFELNDIICFDGTLLISNTEFNIKLIHNATGDVIHDIYITLDNFVDIGTVGGTTLLGNIIGSQLLVKPTNYKTAQFVRIQGQLIIDEDYGFASTSIGNANIHSRVIMMPGSSIQVDPSIEFQIERTFIEGCGGTWEGIDLLSDSYCDFKISHIQDANMAVEYVNNARLRSISSTFLNNGIGVYAHDIANSELDLGGFLIRQTFDANNNSYFSSHVGISCANTNAKDIGGVTFRNMNRGIECVNTDLISGSFNSFYNNNTGIYSRAQDNDLTVFGNFFKETNICIYNSGNQIVRIEGNDVSEGCKDMYRHRSRSPNEQVEIFHNEAIVDRYGIYAITLDNPDSHIRENNITNKGGFNAVILGLSSGDHRWAITEHNNENGRQDKLFTEGGKPNILLRRTNNASVHENLISAFSTETEANVKIYGGERNGVTCNINTNSEGLHNIILNAGVMSRITGNSNTTFLQSNILVKNNCGTCEIRQNCMTSLSYNLEYDALGFTDVQAGQNNMFDASVQPKAIHHGSADQALENQYIVKLGATQGSPEYPFFDSDALEWFDPFWSFPPKSCGNCIPGLIGSDPGEEVSLEDNANAMYDYIMSGLVGNYGVEVEFDAQLKLMRSLIAMDDAGTLIGTLLTYYLANQNTEAYHLAYVDSELKKAAQMSVLDSTLVDSLYEDWRDDIDLYNSIQWYSIDTITGEVTYNSVAIAQRDQLMIDIENTSSQISSIRVPYTSAWNTALTNMQTYNAGITTTTVSGQNLKDANDVYIRYSLAGEHELNATDLAMIQSIGMMCYVEGGEGVLLARNLESNHWGEVIEYSDDCSTIQPMRQAGVPQVGSLSIEPNPSEGSGEVNIEVIGSEEDIDVEVLDLSGRRIWQGNTSQMVDVSQWKGGLYLVRGLGDRGIIYRGRFVVSD